MAAELEQRRRQLPRLGGHALAFVACAQALGSVLLPSRCGGGGVFCAGSLRARRPGVAGSARCGPSLLRPRPRPAPLTRRGRAKTPKELVPFNFEWVLDDQCETPGIAYSHIAPMLTEVAKSIAPDEDQKVDLKKLRIYDPYYCQGGTKRRLAKLGFEEVYNENEDFYTALLDGSTPDFDVLVTNPPFSDFQHVSTFLRFAVSSGKPWMTILPTNYLLHDDYIEMDQEARAAWGRPPFFVSPDKKYNFKTPAPLPKPPMGNRPQAKKRCRIVHTVWAAHSGDDPELQAAMMEAQRKRFRACAVIAELADLPEQALPGQIKRETKKKAKALGVKFPS